ncbi:MAG: 3-hydroxybutyryl-CoA dehydrogenase [Thermomicrobiales bacterium]|nr:3-hydroxybutyryl-CoA dehydrogenase [Thermomicrobiales bacterium]
MPGSMNVFVVGAGRMGSQIACEYAVGGHHVTVMGRTPAAAQQRVADAFETALQAGIVSADRASEARQRVRVVGDLTAFDGTPDFVCESILEDATAKGEMLREVAERWPEATIASNTSSLSISLLGRLAGAEERMLGTHYWNPPLLMPLVEVIAGDRTDPNRVEATIATLRSLGKRPVLVARDVPGFVWNRLQLALVREAAWIVENGVATPAVVDEIVRDGLARRWRYTGPFETMALGGVDSFKRIAENLFPVLSEAQTLAGIEDRITFDPAELTAIRTWRDDGLRHELTRPERPESEARDPQRSTET